MFWDHMEVNPFIKGSGSLPSINNIILKSTKFSIEKLYFKNEIKIENKSITSLNADVPIIVTDPPYFNDVQYAELSELFYIFEKRALYGMDLPKET